MKRIIFSFILTLGFAAVQAQNNTILIYGNLGINSTKNPDDSKVNSFTFSPAVGYQFTDHWTAGVNLKTENWKTTGTSSADIKSSAFGAGPFIRYAHPLSDIFAVYGQLNTNFLSSKTAGVKGNGFEGTLFPAIGVNLKNGFALNFNFGSLSIVTNKMKGADNSSTFGLNFGSGAGFGMSKNFGMK
ncbi:hypothetical protein DYBT9275_02091 [Dyadobacter sp. CECT 9275]|uniref:Outer membrane protein beta-barrel domain-containing protein n=1 Tax=Dyadobacter helix TaxID=2822344 RepID=A0A916JCH2_9BACT|nr:outer membrane beta-barrel protein [Dyadobacter sp. CECT 9275]CAG4998841.1 hypothetical protein DYBT9275_02091 [Dyadobacter sp. CECT 9275]